MILFPLVQRSNFTYVVIAHLIIDSKYYYFDVFTANTSNKIMLENDIKLKSVEPYNPIYIHSRK